MKELFSYLMSNPIEGNEYHPQSRYIMWVSPNDPQSIAHTEPVASFGWGQPESDPEVNNLDAKTASETFNNLPENERTIDNARRIVRTNHGRFIFDLWLDQRNSER